MNWKKESEILDLQGSPEKIRNISILAHVDHGKTSLSDSLLSSNQIISPKLAGKLRYLDSRPDEQERCITMKSSSISLIYNNHLVNVIDSPGHVDFSSEVAAALRACDGGLLLVDVAEGIAPQTYTVLKQSWEEGIKLCLVLNKMDRLILELGLSPVEAYKHVASIIEGVNALVSGFYTERFNKDNQTPMEDEEEYMFSPEKGNVAFCSSLDRWAFTLRDIAIFYSKKMGFNPKVLNSFLWGEFYFTKAKSIAKKPPTANAKQMFVQFVLEPLWRIYSCVLVAPNHDKLQMILKNVQLQVNPKDLGQFSSDPKACLQGVMSTWMPLDSAILGMIIRNLPSPRQAQAVKEVVMCPYLSQQCPEVHEALVQCSADGPVSCYISKMMPIDPAQHIARRPGESVSSHDSLVAFTRVFSGTLQANTVVQVIENNGEVAESLVTHVYLIMGQYLVPIQTAYPGTIVGLGGLQSLVLKSATLSSVPHCPSFSPLSIKATPIVKVAVQPQNLSDMNAIVHGLHLLNRSDNSVDVYVQDNGEHILAVCGEVHLQRCVIDLEETFAKVPVCVSDPIVSFRETIAGQGVAASDVTPNTRCSITVHAFPLSEAFLAFLEQHTQLVQDVYGSVKAPNLAERECLNQQFAEATESLPPPQAQMVLDCLHAFGPRRSCNNLLLYLGKDSLLSRDLREPEESDNENVSETGSTSTSRISTQDLDLNSALIAGFELAMNAGPLCGEPLQGVCIVIEEVKVASAEELKDPYGPFHGQVISTMKDVCRSALMANSPRLVEGIYNCTFQTTQEYVGRLYAVLNKRRGKITQEILQEGTDQFVCEAILPVAESFGFSDELRGVTSGAVVPQLAFSYWHVIAEDPFYIPTTEEELEENGLQPQLDNLPKRYMNEVRRRKGLATDEKLIIHAEKQRNLTKMK